MTGEVSSHITDRMTDRQTDKHDNYRNPRCACAPRVNDRQNEKALKCKPSALIFGHGRAKKSIALQGSYNIGIHVKIM